jgi:hypothetical protein
VFSVCKHIPSHPGRKRGADAVRSAKLPVILHQFADVLYLMSSELKLEQEKKWRKGERKKEKKKQKIIILIIFSNASYYFIADIVKI